MKKLFLLFTLAAIVVSCSEDNLEAETDLVNQQNINLTAKQQTPLPDLDNDDKGLYHGVYVSGTTTKRGLIWINLGNNGEYTAIVEMHSGKTINFKGHPTSRSDHKYHFEAKNAQFDIAIENNTPIITNASVDNEVFFSEVMKETSRNAAIAFTGTFISDDGTVSGTWNLMSDGTEPLFEGFYDVITNAMVTWDGNVYTDSTFESFNFGCSGSIFPPVFGDFEDSFSFTDVYAWGQSSDFNGPTSWNLIAAKSSDTNDVFYDEENNCDLQLTTSGTFTNNGTITGSIIIDVP